LFFYQFLKNTAIYNKKLKNNPVKIEAQHKTHKITKTKDTLPETLQRIEQSLAMLKT